MGEDAAGDLGTLSDEELLVRYRGAEGAGDARALLDELFRRLLIPVLLCCYRCTGDYEWAGDLAQEVLMQAFRRLDSFRGDSKVLTWVYTIARHHCFKAMRAKQAANVQMDEQTLEFISGRGDNPYAQSAREASAESLRDLLKAKLTELEIRVITLHFAEEMTLDAITRLLGLTNASGAKAYVVSAKRKLESALQEFKKAEGA